MAFADWDVEIFDVAPQKNAAKNPHTGLPIDPDGLTLSLFTMRLTHRASGKFLERADLMSAPTAEALKAYARGVIDVAERNMAVQKTDTAPSPLVGLLDLTIPIPALTQAQLDLRAFQQADAALAEKAALIEKLKDASPADAPALDAEVVKLKAIRDDAALAVVVAELEVKP